MERTWIVYKSSRGGLFIAARSDVHWGRWLRCTLRVSSPPKKFPAGRFFDMHTHLGQPWNKRRKLSADVEQKILRNNARRVLGLG